MILDYKTNDSLVNAHFLLLPNIEYAFKVNVGNTIHETSVTTANTSLSSKYFLLSKS